MPNLLASITSQTAGTAPGTYADVPALSAAVSVASASSIILLIATIPIALDAAADNIADVQFAVDGVREGPEIPLVLRDGADEGLDGTIVYALTGISGSVTLSCQWQARLATTILDTGRDRAFTVIELLDGEADLLVNISSTTGGSAPATYADVPDFSATPTIGSTDSVLLFLAMLTYSEIAGIQDADVQFAVGGAREGPEMSPATGDSGSKSAGGVISHVKTGISGATTLSCQWQDRAGTPALDTTRARSFQVLELKSASLLLNIISVTAGTAPATYADVPAFSGSPTVGAAGSVVLFGVNIPIDAAASGDQTADVQFADGGVREGPEPTSLWRDNVDHLACSGIMWAKTGISGVRTFSVQWQDRTGTPTLDTGRNRSFYVIELKSAVVAVVSDIVVNYAAQVGLQKDAGVNQEAGQGIIEDKGPNLETLIGVIEDAGPEMEAEQGITENLSPNLESLISVQEDQTPNLESLVGIQEDAGPSVESQGTVTQDEGPNVESLITVIEDAGPDVEAGQGITEDLSPNLEALVGIREDAGPNIEAKGLITQNLSPNFEALIGVTSDEVALFESLLTITKDAGPNAETLQAIRNDVAGNIEALGTVLKDAGVDFETLVGILNDVGPNYEALGRVFSDRGVNVEALGTVSRAILANFESLITVFSPLAPAVNLSTFLIVPVVLALICPLDEQDHSTGDVEQLDLTLSLDEE